LIAIPISLLLGGTTNTFESFIVSAKWRLLYKTCAKSLVFLGLANLIAPFGVLNFASARNPSPGSGVPDKNTLAFGE
jgi:hypothetical protein